MTRIQKITTWVVIIISLIVLDFIIGYQQERFLIHKKEIKKRLERLAYYCLRSDVTDVSYTRDGRYRITMKYENALNYNDLFIMLPSINVSIQVGTIWKEVPVFGNPDSNRSGIVIRLQGKETISEIADINVRNYTELMERMHVKVTDNVFVAFEEEPKEHVIEKRREYFVYIKPYHLRSIKKGPIYLATR